MIINRVTISRTLNLPALKGGEVQPVVLFRTTSCI
jgi:hypothetical protein